MWVRVYIECESKIHMERSNWLFTSLNWMSLTQIFGIHLSYSPTCSIKKKSIEIFAAVPQWIPRCIVTILTDFRQFLSKQKQNFVYRQISACYRAHSFDLIALLQSVDGGNFGWVDMSNNFRRTLTSNVRNYGNSCLWVFNADATFILVVRLIVRVFADITQRNFWGPFVGSSGMDLWCSLSKNIEFILN